MVRTMTSNKSALKKAIREARGLVVRAARAFLNRNLFALSGRRRRRIENEAVRAWFAAVRRCREPREQAVLLYLSYRRALGDVIDRDNFLELAEGGEAAAEVAEFYNSYFLEPGDPGLTAESVAAFFDDAGGKASRFKRVRNKYDKAQSRLNERFACSLCVRHHAYAEHSCAELGEGGYPWEAIFDEFQRALLTHERGCGCQCLDRLSDEAIEGRETR